MNMQQMQELVAWKKKVEKELQELRAEVEKLKTRRTRNNGRKS